MLLLIACMESMEMPLLRVLALRRNSSTLNSLLLFVFAAVVVSLRR